MNISRDNYELTFLMYVDNELSAAERNAVESFVRENPDLKNELDALQSATLLPEELVFIPKTLLYKNAALNADVNESLLCHLDGELTNEHAQVIEHEIANNEQTRSEWELLKKTKLETVAVRFPDKPSLYRRSKNVIIMRFARIAVAAMLIGFGFFIGASFFDKQPTVDPVIIAKTPGAGEPIIEQPINKSTLASGSLQSADTNISSDIPATVLPLAQNKSGLKQNVSSISNKIDDRNVKDIEPVLTNRDNFEIQQPELIADAEPATSNKIPDMIDRDITPAAQTYASLAVNEETSDDRILYMDEDKLSRTKVGGLFRKIKRVVERNAKISTPNGLRIGGFEFAVK